MASAGSWRFAFGPWLASVAVWLRDPTCGGLPYPWWLPRPRSFLPSCALGTRPFPWCVLVLVVDHRPLRRTVKEHLTPYARPSYPDCTIVSVHVTEVHGFGVTHKTKIMPSSRLLASSIETMPSPGMRTVWRLLRILEGEGTEVDFP